MCARGKANFFALGASEAAGRAQVNMNMENKKFLTIVHPAVKGKENSRYIRLNNDYTINQSMEMKEYNFFQKTYF